MELNRILIVEDDPTQLRMIATVLGMNKQCEVLTAQSAASGWAVAEEKHPALIISDYYMPVENGISFCKRIKSHPTLRDTMFMLLTASADVQDKVSALDIGADDFLSKPFHADEFNSRVRALLRIKGLRDELKEERDELRKVNDTLEASAQGIISLLLRLISIRVPNAEVRSRFAERLCRWISKKISLSKEATDLLVLTAQLHEIGKVTFQDDLLKKQPSDLTHEEVHRLSEHVIVSHGLVSEIPQFSTISPWLRHQLENYDGSGYPDKLRGVEIPIEVRILRVVNFLDALPQETLQNHDLVSEALQRVRGTVLDPHIVTLVKEYFIQNLDPDYFKGLQQVSVDTLEAGMTLALDLVTGSGMKLLPKGMEIQQSHIDRIRSQNHFDPIMMSIYILPKKK